MAVNRFNRVAAPARFSPLSFEEQSFAPIAMREREDALMASNDEILAQMENIEVSDNYQDYANQERDAMRDELNGLAEQIQSGGATLDNTNKFRNLRNKYNKLVSTSGGLGMANRAKLNVDAAHAAYMEDAINSKGQPAFFANLNWEKEKEKYLQGLPSDLSNFEGSMPDFNPEFAPNSTDVFDTMKEISEMATGITKAGKGDFTFEEGPNGEILIVNEEGLVIDDDAQLDALRSYMQKTLLNPDSDLNRSLKYRQQDPMDFLSDIDDLIKMRDNYTKTEKRSVSQVLNSGKDTKKKTRAGTTPTEPEEGEVGLQQLTTGKEKLEGVNTNGLKKRKAALIQNADGLSDAAMNRELTEVNHQLELQKELEGNETFQEKMQANLSDDQYWVDRGVTTYNDYLAFEAREEVTAAREAISESISGLGRFGDDQKKFYSDLQALSDDEVVAALNDPQWLEKNPDFRDKSATVLPDMSTLNVMYDEKKKEIQSHKDTIANQHSELSNELLNPSTFYAFYGFGKDSSITKSIGDAVNAIGVVGLANEGVLKIADGDGSYQAEFGNNTTTGELGDRHRELEEYINNGEAKWNLTGLIDNGLNRPGKLTFKVTASQGSGSEKHTISRDVSVVLDPNKLNSFTAKFLDPQGEVYASLDRESRLVLDGIRDKNDYGSVATDTFDQETIYSAADTANIQSNALNMISKEYGVASQVKGEGPLSQSLFINPKSTEYDYSIRVNADHSYSAVRRNEEGFSEVMNFAQYAKGRGALKIAQSPEHAHTIGQERYKVEDAILGKATVMHDLLTINPNVDSKEAKGMVLFNSNPRFQEGLQKWNELYNRLSPSEKSSEWAMKQAAAIFDEYIGPLEVNSRLLKEIL